MSMENLKLQKTEIIFEYFDLNKDSTYWKAYLDGQKKALQAFGVEKIIKSESVLKNAHLILATTNDGNIVGGFRFHCKTDNYLLPIEMNEYIYKDIINHKIQSILFEDENICELCGLWVDSKYRGHDIGYKLIVHTLEWAFKLNYENVIAMSSGHTFDLMIRAGFFKDKFINDFNYPDDRYLSQIVWAKKPQTKSLLSVLDNL